MPRCYFTGKQELKSTELHCSSDSSKNGYAGVLYLRSVYEDGQVDVNLVASKTHVAPQSIPRLELLGANVLLRLENTVKSTLSIAEAIRVVNWTDSKTVLCWIRNAKPWKQYVQSRLLEIRENSENESLRFYPGQQNPADWHSNPRTFCKGVGRKLDLVQGTWISIPPWNWKATRDGNRQWTNQESWRRNNELPTSCNSFSDYRRDRHTRYLVIDLSKVINFSRIGTWQKLYLELLRTYGISQSCLLKEPKGSDSTVQEIHKSEELWIKTIQLQAFSSTRNRAIVRDENVRFTTIPDRCLDFAGPIYVKGKADWR